ncbi:hypothetical protein V8C42DRAFT_334034 [Trichoderma barbatum]
MVTRTAHTYNVQCRIPPDISASDVINTLHCPENLLTRQPQISSYNKINSNEASDFDSYFDKFDYPLRVYKATEKVTIVPGIGDWGKYPTSLIVTFQDTADGLKSRAVASAGVVVTATYAVKQIHRQDPVNDTNDRDMRGDGNWMLTQSVALECSDWLMPFVKQNMEIAQRNMCQNLVNRASSS